jgi:methyl-accepting chemotaxis protein
VLSQHLTEIGVDVVDLAGFLDEIDAQSRTQLDVVSDAQRHARAVVQANATVRTALQEVSTASTAALDIVDSSIAELRGAGTRTQEVATWVRDLEQRMSDVEQRLQAVTTSNAQIANIAKQVNILAVNAKIEAARAGDTGRGFAVVAEAINELSQKTAAAAGQITTSVADLDGLIGVLKGEAETISHTATSVINGASVTDSALAEIAQKVRGTAATSERITSEAEKVRDAIASFEPAFEGIGTAVRSSADGIDEARRRIAGLVDMTETLVQDCVRLGGQSTDQDLINAVRGMAKQVSAIFEDGLRSGQIGMEDLFTRVYTQIAGSDPQQVMAPFTPFTDRVLPPIQEAALDLDPRIVFCAVVDTNGYLPTHNRKFSQTQSGDPVWNVANCRNRRIFDDRVGLKAGRNTEPFLLQVYRRDMGGGIFTMMKDLSAPIVVDGMHWGGVRLAFKIH